VTDDPYLVLLNVTDKASAQSWTTGVCKKSKVGRMLARFFCSLMINSPLGINSKWISTDENKVADDISCIKKESADEDSPPFFDYWTLTQRYPELIHCSSFRIQPKLISLIWEIVLTKRWPCHNEIRRLRLRGMKAPVNTSNPNNMVEILINNLVKEEDIARQHSPFDSNIFTKLLQKSNVSCLPDSEQCTSFNLVTLGCYIGPCVSKYAQTTDKNVDYHVYPS
jgi:hypothetical protein